MNKTLIVNAKIVNENVCFEGDVLIVGNRISKIERGLSSQRADVIVDAKGKILMPGVIDDQVHFREPGLTHKGTIYTEAKAAVSGGVTSFMEMPNTIPPVLTQDLLEEKYQIASQCSLANYSFYMGSSPDNIEEVLKTDVHRVCGLKIFMGSSTGDMLVDDEASLHLLFGSFPSVIAVHCEDEETVSRNKEKYVAQYGDDIPMAMHEHIRDAEACYLSSSRAVALAKKHGTRLHVLHISTAQEVSLFDSSFSLAQKKITAEACVHHLWFNHSDYDRLGSLIKWNPSIKSINDQQAVLEAVLNDNIDVIASDHAPHTLEEKQQKYELAPSGGPLVQHGLVAMLELYKQKKISLEKIVTKMSHNPAILFSIKDRGFIREGYYADMVLVDLEMPWQVSKEKINALCGWSPFEGEMFHANVVSTWVSGHRAYNQGYFDESVKGHRLTFNRS